MEAHILILLSYLHHKQKSIADNENHDEIFKWS